MCVMGMPSLPKEKKKRDDLLYYIFHQGNPSLFNMSSKIHAFNSSRIGHCSALCVGLSQNAAACLSTNTPRPEHITPVLHTLHWRPVHLTTDFKVLLSVFKALSGLASLYLLGILPLHKKKTWVYGCPADFR